jgi:hypothetical protein
MLGLAISLKLGEIFGILKHFRMDCRSGDEKDFWIALMMLLGCVDVLDSVVEVFELCC